MIFWASVIFLVKSTLQIEQLFEKGVNLLVNFGKNDNWFKNYISCKL